MVEYDLRCECASHNIRNATGVQALEISRAFTHCKDGRWDWDTRPDFKINAAQQFQMAILALQLTSLRLDWADCGGHILPQHTAGNLAKLRCYSSEGLRPKRSFDGFIQG